MKKFILIIFIIALNHSLSAQNHGFKFGQVTYNELGIKACEFDTTANAIVLNEFGESYFDNSNDHNLIHEYHVKIKILNNKAFEKANISIPLRKHNGKTEYIRTLKASTFNLENNRISEVLFDPKKIFTENQSKYQDLKKFTLPDIREGSVIEIMYTIEIPFFFNYMPWHFQTDIPKIYSEYWASIPANYDYNIVLKGPFKLTKQDATLIKEGFDIGGGMKADCSLLKFGMKNIPAFNEEDFMTAKNNFISGINFELSQVKLFDGRTDKISKEWKDVDQELKEDNNFGKDIKRGKDFFKDKLPPTILLDTNRLNQAKAVYNIIKEHFRWNEYYGKYSEVSIKKAYETKTGNCGDINLSLVAALQACGLNAEPVILSTRQNGLPNSLYPVISDFDYVIARVNINHIDYLLDATDDYLPFAMLPLRCLNGQGRLIPGKSPSSWIDLKPSAKYREVYSLNLKLESDGKFSGIITLSSAGYRALEKRKQISKFNSQDEYIEDLDDKWNKVKIGKYEIENIDSLDKPVIEKYTVSIDGFDNLNNSRFFLNPFFVERWTENPFKSNNRTYPVDFGAPIESTTFLHLEYPTNIEIKDQVQKLGLQLPNAGGKYIFESSNKDNILNLSTQITLNKSIYTSEEYHYVKELFNQIIQNHKTDLTFQKKKS